MAGFCRITKLPNVVGRIDYISNPKRQEHIEDFYSTADLDFWNLLADECQTRYKQQTQKKVKSKCCEAREFILAIPQDRQITAEQLAEWFKTTYSVECAVALHYKAEKNNFHAHIVFSERERLAEPKITSRTYYYDAHGKKCKKAEAIKIVPKGTTRYFSEKNAVFKSFSFTQEFKELVLNETFGLALFDKTRHFPQQKIGTKNPKQEHIEAKNALVRELNEYFDLVEPSFENGTPKEAFCNLCNRTYISCYEIDKIKAFFTEFKELYPFTEKMAKNRILSLTEQKNELEADLLNAKKMYQPASTDLQAKVNSAYKRELEAKYQDKGESLINKIKSLLKAVVDEIQRVVTHLKPEENNLMRDIEKNTDKTDIT